MSNNSLRPVWTPMDFRLLAASALAKIAPEHTERAELARVINIDTREVLA